MEMRWDEQASECWLDDYKRQEDDGFIASPSRLDFGNRKPTKSNAAFSSRWMTKF